MQPIRSGAGRWSSTIIGDLSRNPLMQHAYHQYGTLVVPGSATFALVVYLRLRHISRQCSDM